MVRELLQGLKGWYTGSAEGELYRREQARKDVEAQINALQTQLQIDRTQDMLETGALNRLLAVSQNLRAQQTHETLGRNLGYEGFRAAERQQGVLDLQANLDFQQQADEAAAARSRAAIEDVTGLPWRQAVSTFGATPQLTATGSMMLTPNLPSANARQMETYKLEAAELSNANAATDYQRGLVALDDARARLNYLLETEQPQGRVMAMLNTQMAIWQAELAEIETDRKKLLAGLLTDAEQADLVKRILTLNTEIDQGMRWAQFLQQNQYFGSMQDWQAQQDRLQYLAQQGEQEAHLRSIPTVQITEYGPERAAIEWLKETTNALEANTKALQLAADVADIGSSPAGTELASAISLYQKRMADAQDDPATQQWALEQLVIAATKIKEKYSVADLGALSQEAQEFLRSITPGSGPATTSPAAQGTDGGPFVGMPPDGMRMP